MQNRTWLYFPTLKSCARWGTHLQEGGSKGHDSWIDCVILSWRLTSQARNNKMVPKTSKIWNDVWLVADGCFPEQRALGECIYSPLGSELWLEVSTCPPESGNEMTQLAPTAATWTALRHTNYCSETWNNINRPDLAALVWDGCSRDQMCSWQNKRWS